MALTKWVIAHFFNGLISVKASEIVETIKAAIEPGLESQGLEVVDLEYRREPIGMVLRVFIDQPSGVNLDTCANASELISRALDEADIINSSYNLEVSSPGVERRLTNERHFRRFIGKEVLVKTIARVNGRKRFKGKLIKADDTGFTIEVEGVNVSLDYEQVAKANLVFTDERV